MQKMITNAKPALKIFIRLPNGNGCELSVNPSVSLQKIVSQIQQTSLQLPHSFRLVVNGKRIKNYSLSLEEIGVTANSIIHVQPVQVKGKRSTKIDVAFLFNGEKIIVQQETTSTVLLLKQAIAAVTKINPKNQILVFLGKKLKNCNTLQHYNIGSDSLLSLLTENIVEIAMDKNQMLFNQRCDLINSVVSLAQKRSGVSTSSLFRSDSLNKRNVEELQPYEVSVHQRKHQQENSKFKEHQLFKSCKETDSLNDSITFNVLFESVGETKSHQLDEKQENCEIQEIREEQKKPILSSIYLAGVQENNSIQFDD